MQNSDVFLKFRQMMEIMFERPKVLFLKLKIFQRISCEIRCRKIYVLRRVLDQEARDGIGTKLVRFLNLPSAVLTLLN